MYKFTLPIRFLWKRKKYSTYSFHAMAYCVGCGNELMEDWKACPSCGTMKAEIKGEEKSEKVANGKEPEFLLLLDSVDEWYLEKRISESKDPNFKMGEGDLESAMEKFEKAAALIDHDDPNHESIIEKKAMVPMCLLELARHFSENDDYSNLGKVCEINDKLYPEDASEKEKSSGKFSFWESWKAAVVANQGSAPEKLGSKTGKFAVKYVGFSKRHHEFAIKEPEGVTKISIGPTGLVAKLSAVKIEGRVISEVTGKAGFGTFHAKWSSNFSLPSGRKYSIKLENKKFGTKGITLLTSASLTNADGVTKKVI